MFVSLKNYIIIYYHKNLTQNTHNRQILHAKTELLRYACEKARQLQKINLSCFFKKY